MANYTCRISGLRLTVPHFSSLETPASELLHPIFTLPLAKLAPLVPQHFQCALTPEESYLLYLAYWNKTKLISFRSPARFCELTAGIIARNLAELVQTVSTLQYLTLDLPTIVISPECDSLENSPDWLAAWEQCFKDHKDSYKTSTALERLTRKETVLERYIKDPTKDISTYAYQLAAWASDAGEFPGIPAGLAPDTLKGIPMSLAAYWRHIIKLCCKSESQWDIPQEVLRQDLQELIEHCEEHIPHGSIYAQELMSLLRSGETKVSNYLSVGDVDIGMNGTVFRILNGDASVEDAAKIALIDSAPKTKPVESDYPNKLAFLRAKMNFTLAEDYRKSDEIKIKLAEAEALVSPAPAPTNPTQGI